MRMTLRRRRDAQAEATVSGFSGAVPGGGHQGLDDEDLGQQSSLTTSYSRGHELGTRALTVALLAAITCGPVALGWQLLGPTEEPVITEQVGFDQRMVSRRDVASELGVQFVTTWLGSSAGQEGELARYWSGQVNLPREAPAVASVRAVDAVASAPGVWSVTVAAVIGDAGGQPVQRFFQVPIRVEGDAGEVSAAPMTLPAVVSGPVVLGSPGAGSYPTLVSTSGSIGVTVSAFLRAYLTGSEDPERYLTPGSDLAVPTAVEPFAAVQVTEVRASDPVPGTSDGTVPGDGSQVHVLVSVRLADDSEQPAGLSASYPLMLTARGGRWEVTQIDRALHASTSTTADVGASTQSSDDDGSSGQ